ncbi:MAG TPA: AzlD domain-containing protein [Candidatus Limnocylindria bacterium]|nr:AzlD domain-containing protein [Candidatus Limnocylindria bacterium]
MTPLLVAAVAAITYGSRLAAMAVLPRPSGRVERILERVVPAIFASIATLSLITDQPGLVDGPILLAAAGALLVAPRRSFALCLVAGLAGYVIGRLVL